jgi:hydrogenase nickel incorporation protein HypB
MDLAEAVEFNLHAVNDNIQSVRPGMPVFRVSTKSGAGVDDWLRFLVSAKSQAISAALA